MMEIEIDSKMLFEFRKNACENQSDGYDRGLWYDKKEKKFFETCETKSTNYVFNNPNDILCLIFVSGDNNAMGLSEVCEYCHDCPFEDEDEDMKEKHFEETCLDILDDWYPIEAYNWGTDKIEDIYFEEV